MPTMPVPLQRGDRVEDADYRDALPINVYSVIKEIKGSQGYIINHPGLRELAQGVGVDRGGVYSDRFESHFRVSGNSLIEVSATGAITNLSGTPGQAGFVEISGNFQVRFAQSFNNLAIVADNKVWYYSRNKGLRQIDVNFADEFVPPASGVSGQTLGGATNVFQAERALAGNGSPNQRNGTYVSTNTYGYYDADTNIFHGAESGGASSVRHPLYVRRRDDGDFDIIVASTVSGTPGTVANFSSYTVNESPFTNATTTGTFTFSLSNNGTGSQYTSDLSNQITVTGNQNAGTFGSPIDIVFINQVFLFTDSEELYHTSVANEEIVLPDANATAEFLPDGITGLERQKDNLVVAFGRFSTEYFGPNAADTFAFRRVQGLASKIGVINQNAKTELDGAFFVIGGRDYESTSVHQIVSGNSKVVATREIEKILATYNRLQLITASLETRVEDGDKLIYVHLPNQTLLYNHTVAMSAGIQNAWSVLKTSVVRNDFWRGIHSVFDQRSGQWIVGDRLGPTIGIVDNTISTIYGNDAEWIVYTPFLLVDGASIDQLEIKTISGFTSKSGRIAISLTYEGEIYGREWVTEYGAPQERDRRLIFRRLGSVQNQVSIKVRGVIAGRIALGAGILTYG